MGKFDKQVQQVIDKGTGNFVVIDGSLLCFRASAAGEKKTITATYTPSGVTKAFNNRTEFKKYIKEKNIVNEGTGKFYDLEDFVIEDVVFTPPLKVNIKNAESIIAHILTMCSAEEYAIYLDEGETFRHKLATVQEYKGQRSGEKPVNFKKVWQHLIAVHGAKVVTHIEADDVLSCYAYAGYNLTKSGSKRKIIAATFDKDAWSCNGWVFDFRKNEDGFPMMMEPFFVDGLGELHYHKSGCKGFGAKFAAYQWVCGDKADNYKASKLASESFGDRAAHNLLKDLETEEECFNAVVEQYKAWYPEPVTYMHWDGVTELTRDYKEIAQEYWDLARMRRWEDDEVKFEDYLETK